jgi:hypothetical protein
MLIRNLWALYLAFGLFALAVAVLDPSDDPLSTVFLVIAALPWTSALGWLLDRFAAPPPWLGLVLRSLGVAINAFLLYLLGRWIIRRRKRKLA